MGISIEVYRARIATHNNVKAKYQASCCLEAKVKCHKDTILCRFVVHTIKLFINEFYLPCLNQMVSLVKHKSENDVVDWLTQMLCFNVYLPLLLRLSNDVEENPGPTIYEIIDPSETVTADFSQGDLRFGQNGGNNVLLCQLHL